LKLPLYSISMWKENQVWSRIHEVEYYLLNCSVHGISLRFLLSNNSSAKKIQLTNHTSQGAVKGIMSDRDFCSLWNAVVWEIQTSSDHPWTNQVLTVDQIFCKILPACPSQSTKYTETSFDSLNWMHYPRSTHNRLLTQHSRQKCERVFVEQLSWRKLQQECKHMPPTTRNAWQICHHCTCCPPVHRSACSWVLPASNEMSGRSAESSVAYEVGCWRRWEGRWFCANTKHA